MKLLDVERGFRDLVMRTDERLMPADPARQRVYRRLVRGNLFTAVRRAIPITRKILGDDVAEAWIARWLDERGPQTRLVRDVAGEFAEWLLGRTDLPHAAAGELAHWEVVEVEVALAPDAEPSGARAPVDGARVATHPSARLCAYRHAVQALTASSTAYPEPGDPVILLAWRAGERFCWKELEGGVAKVLVETSQGQTLGDAFAAVESALADGDVLDRKRVKAALVDLLHRGALTGFPR